MRPKIFLMGGLGNIYYQLNHMHGSYNEDYDAYLVLYNKPFRSLLSHTQPLSGAFNKKNCKSNIFALLWMLILIFDVILFRIAKLCLFTTLDTSNLKYNTPLIPFIFLGYFQNGSTADKRGYYLSDIIRNNISNNLEHVDYDCVHFRYGDYMAAYDKENKLNTNMPMPTKDWFETALNTMNLETGVSKLEIVTDNADGAKRFFSNVEFGNYEQVTISSKDFLTDISIMFHATGLINYNSTMSLMAAEEAPKLKTCIMSHYLKTKCMTRKLTEKSSFL